MHNLIRSNKRGIIITLFLLEGVVVDHMVGWSIGFLQAS
jgi:hypothetical protein